MNERYMPEYFTPGIVTYQKTVAFARMTDLLSLVPFVRVTVEIDGQEPVSFNIVADMPELEPPEPSIPESDIAENLAIVTGILDENLAALNAEIDAEIESETLPPWFRTPTRSTL